MPGRRVRHLRLVIISQLGLIVRWCQGTAAAAIPAVAATNVIIPVHKVAANTLMVTAIKSVTTAKSAAAVLSAATLLQINVVSMEVVLPMGHGGRVFQSR